MGFPPTATRSQPLSSMQRSAARFHVVFAILAGLVVWAPVDVAIGWKVAGLLAFYDLATVLICLRAGHREWLRAWCFAAVLSLFMVWPDRFLTEVLGVLVFPADGFPDIGAVTGYMAALWTIPVVVVLLVARAAEDSVQRWAAYVVAALVAGVVIGGSEQYVTQLGIWEPRNVSTWGNVARYILPAEVLLGPVAYGAFSATRRNPLAAIPAAALVMVAYLGAAAASYLLVEVSGLV